MNEKIVSIYENIYNKELEWKNSLDDKFYSRLLMLISITTATFVILTTVFFSNSNQVEFKKIHFMIGVCIILSSISFILWIGMCVFFYKCFFRMKKSYKVMPTVDIRMFHFYVQKNNLCGTKDEEDLYNYLNDSYQVCAFTNASINSKREHLLIVFDNIAVISFIILIGTYILMVQSGYSIGWIF